MPKNILIFLLKIWFLLVISKGKANWNTGCSTEGQIHRVTSHIEKVIEKSLLFCGVRQSLFLLLIAKVKRKRVQIVKGVQKLHSTAGAQSRDSSAS